MKMFLIAVAMATAAPAFAQTAPANPHADHGAAAKPAQDPHAGHKMPAQGQADPHAGHDMGDCCKKDADGKMACCKKMAAMGSGGGCCAGKKGESSAADPHAGHDMSGGAHAGHADTPN